ncbi:MAG: hypothetical protein IKO47_04370 [Ruminococcus sp.]|nr:hypothetical protein [Ruminococcus sp.]
MKDFIGGSKMVNSLTYEFINELDRICSEGHEILIGDCFGVDLLVQKYLNERGYTNVTVYVSGDKVRCNYGDFPVKHIQVSEDVSGFDFRRQKDIAMARDADCGLMLWDSKSRGTAANIAELKAMHKEVVVYESSPAWSILGD